VTGAAPEHDADLAGRGRAPDDDPGLRERDNVGVGGDESFE
jgi:hypothetical protein